MRTPHKYSTREEYPTEPRLLPEDVVELQNQLKNSVSHMEEAVASHDFVRARACVSEERQIREKLQMLNQQHGLQDWVFD